VASGSSPARSLRSRPIPVAIPLAVSELIPLPISDPFLVGTLRPALIPQKIPFPRTLAAKSCLPVLLHRAMILEGQPFAVQLAFQPRQPIPFLRAPAYIVPGDASDWVTSLRTVLETHANAGKVDSDSDAYGLRFHRRRYNCERQTNSQCT